MSQHSKEESSYFYNNLKCDFRGEEVKKSKDRRREGMQEKKKKVNAAKQAEKCDALREKTVNQ